MEDQSEGASLRRFYANVFFLGKGKLGGRGKAALLNRISDDVIYRYPLCIDSLSFLNFLRLLSSARLTKHMFLSNCML